MIDPAIVLLIWPVVAIGIMASRGMVSGVIWVTVLGYLFLPDSFKVDLPGLPPYSKSTAIAVSLVLGALFFGRRAQEDKPIHTDGLANTIFLCLAILLVTSPVGTFLNNRNTLVTGDLVRSGLAFWDVVSTFTDLCIVLVPYYVGRRWMATPEHHARLMTVLVIMVLCYSFLAIFEARMSPQLNRIFYGYFPHSWIQHLRDGFRPVIFLDHGLSLGFLLLSVILASFAMSRQDPKLRLFYLGAGVWLLLVLLISRNLGATLLALMFLPIALFVTTRIQVRIAALIAVMFLSFPVIRSAEVVNFDGFIAKIETASPKRAASFEYRLRNEDDLLARAQEKPWFGWGGWARALVFDEQGRNTSVQDGTWIIVIGERGWLGYIAYFGLIAFPLLLLPRAGKRKEIEPATAGLALITAANLVYVIPNSTLSAIGWLTFGALAGYVQFDMSRSKAQDAALAGKQDTPTAQGVRYTRFDSETTEGLYRRRAVQKP